MITDRFTGETYEVVDMHAHLGTWFNFSQVKPDLPALRRALKCAGIDRFMASHTLALVGEIELGNAKVDEMSREMPELMGYVGVNPHYEAASLEQLDRWLGKGCFKGMKMHPETHVYRITDPSCQSLFRVADNAHCPVLIHVMSPEAIKDCAEIAARYPNLSLLMGHSGGVDYRVQALECCCDFPNVFFDLTSSMMKENCLEWMVERVGADRILFGSDVPFIDAKHSVGQVLYSRLSTEDKRKIFSENARRILAKSVF